MTVYRRSSAPSVPAGFAQRLKNSVWRLSFLAITIGHTGHNRHTSLSAICLPRDSFRAEVNVILVPAASQTYEPLIIAGVHGIGPT